jgi:glutathione S-transferase
LLGLSHHVEWLALIHISGCLTISGVNMITLWGRNNSTNVKKVLWTLEELDLPFKQIMAGLQYGVNKEAEYLAMNPNGLVPLLRDDETDLTLWESNTIVRYLAAQYGQSRLGWKARQNAPRVKNGWTGQTRRSLQLTGLS